MMHNYDLKMQLFVELFVRLAKHSLGYLDWSPYISQVFNNHASSL